MTYELRKSKGAERNNRDYKKNWKKYEPAGRYAKRGIMKKIEQHRKSALRRQRKQNPEEQHNKRSGPRRYLYHDLRYTTIGDRKSQMDAFRGRCTECDDWFCHHYRRNSAMTFLLCNQVLPKEIAVIIAKMIYYFI